MAKKSTAKKQTFGGAIRDLGFNAAVRLLGSK